MEYIGCREEFHLTICVNICRCFLPVFIFFLFLLCTGGVPDLSLMTDGKFTENISGCVEDIGLLDKGPIDIDSQAVGGFNVGPCLG